MVYVPPQSTAEIIAHMTALERFDGGSAGG
jgi:hypothetical protein